MAVDESYLEVIVRSLRALGATHREKIIESEKLHNIFKTIMLEENGEFPQDPQTGKTMTKARRDEIYDSRIEYAHELLGIRSEGEG